MADPKIPSYSFCEVRRILTSSIQSLQPDYDNLYFLVTENEASSSEKEQFDIVFGSMRVLNFLQSMLDGLKESFEASEGGK